MTRMRPRRTNASERAGDEGSTLVIVLVMSIICALIVVPTLTFAIAVIKAAPVHAPRLVERKPSKVVSV